jgi:hypothetical protein
MLKLTLKLTRVGSFVVFLGTSVLLLVSAIEVARGYMNEVTIAESVMAETRDYFVLQGQVGGASYNRRSKLAKQAIADRSWPQALAHIDVLINRRPASPFPRVMRAFALAGSGDFSDQFDEAIKQGHRLGPYELSLRNTMTDLAIQFWPLLSIDAQALFRAEIQKTLQLSPEHFAKRMRIVGYRVVLCEVVLHSLPVESAPIEGCLTDNG